MPRNLVFSNNSICIITTESCRLAPTILPLIKLSPYFIYTPTIDFHETIYEVNDIEIVVNFHAHVFYSNGHLDGRRLHS